MKRKNHLLITSIALLLTVAMLAALLGCHTEKGQDSTSLMTQAPSDTQSDTTVTDTDAPDTTFSTTSEEQTSETTPAKTTPADTSVATESVTEPPTTEPPTTEPLTTEPSTTEPPTTAPPTTEPPVTEPPATDSVISTSETEPPEPIEWPVTSDHELLRQVLSEAAAAYGAVGIQAAVISQGKVGATGVFGWQTYETVPMADDTKIRVASLSKTAVGMVAMRLVDEGLLALDENVETYLGFPMRNYYYPDTPITLRHLLTHTVGFRYVDYVANLEELKTVLVKKSTYQNQLPGSAEAYYYSNFGYGVIGTICEIVTGESLSALANTYFFAPMGIEASWAATGFDPDKLATIYDAKHRVGLSVEDLLTRIDPTAPAEAMKYYAGGLIVSAADFAKLLTLLMNDGIYDGQRYLSSESIAQMKTVPVPKNEMAEQCLTVARFPGLYGEEVLYYHTGSAYGVYALYTFDDVTKTGVVVVTTGAVGTKDDNGIYAVCSQIAAAVHQNREAFTETPTETPDSISE
jgi:CubicO group peptidase (beta-lactamase class C family)